MATTDARRQRNSPDLTSTTGNPTPVRLGVQWGYPFSLVRRLSLAFVFLAVAFFVAAYVLSQPLDPGEILIHILPVAAAILLSLYVSELVGVTERPLPPLTVEALFWAIATSCIVMAIGYAIIPTYAPSTLLVCAAPVVSALCVYLQRKWIDVRGASDEAIPAVLFAGDRTEARRSMAELADAPGVVVKAIILPEPVLDRSSMAGLPVYSPSRGFRWFREEKIQLFVVGNADPENLGQVLAPCAGAGCIVERVEPLVAKTHGRLALSAADDVALLGQLTNRANRFSAQRGLDLLLSLILLPPTLILSFFVAIAVKVTSRGPIVFSQIRTGRWGREFNIYKFRTMREDAERETGPVWAQEDDPRITRLGRFLRRTRLDEMPQLWNVIRGDMSLVGPRPERPFFIQKLSKTVPLYDARHSVRPGITGWAQVRYRYGSDHDDAKQKLAFELFYILNRSLTFYFAVLLETTKVILFRRGGR